MKCRTGLLILALISSAALADDPATQPALYRINLSPPVKVGETFPYRVFEAEASQTTSRQKNGKPRTIESSSTSLQLESTASVEACDARGLPSSVKLKVSFIGSPYSTLLPSGQLNSLCTPGSEVFARSAVMQTDPPRYRDVFALGDGPIHPVLVAALRKVITIGNEAEPSEQQAFGTDKALPLGGTWPLDGAEGAKLLAKMQIDADPKDVTGTGQLVNIVEFAGEACLNVHLTVQCRKYKPEVREGLVLNSARITGELTYQIAKDSGRVLAARYQSHADIETAYQGKDPVIVEHFLDRSRDIQTAEARK